MTLIIFRRIRDPDDDEINPWIPVAIVAAVLAFMVGCFVQLSRM